MAGTVTRKMFRDLMSSLKDEVCIIPSETFVELLQKNTDRDERLCNVLERIANTIDISNSNMLQHFSKMELKMDQLIIAGNDTSAMETSFYSIGEKLEKLTETITNTTKHLAGDDEKIKLFRR